MKLLLFGASGKLGSALKEQLSAIGKLTSFSRTDLDITDGKAVSDAMESCRPNIVVNAAAFTDVRASETHQKDAGAVNAIAVGQLGRVALDCGAIVVHFSTDFVFDGSASDPYQEDAQTSPLNAYGESKLKGEEALIDSGAQCAILRTSWLFAASMNNFVGTMIAKTKSGEPLRVVNDQIGSPTAVPVVAQSVRAMLARPQEALVRELEISPIFHLACRGSASWFDLAQAALSDARLPTNNLTPISTQQSGETLVRPAYSVLHSRRFEQAFSVRLPHWRAALRPIARALG